MKKIFTLAIAALAALSVSAQDVASKQTLAFTGNAWNVNVLATGNVGITCNSQWGEYKLTSESFDAADYSKLHVEYTDLVQAEKETVSRLSLVTLLTLTQSLILTLTLTQHLLI